MDEKKDLQRGRDMADKGQADERQAKEAERKGKVDHAW